MDPPPQTPARTCAVTGASGYVGSRVARRLAGAGWQIRALARTPAQGCDWAQVRFVLGEEVQPAALAGVDALVHVAYDFAPTRWREIWAVNVEGSRRLLAAARTAGVQRIVVMSTTAAFPGSSSRYGRAKLEIELAALEAGAAAIRPGLVWGPQGAAMFGALQRALARLPVVPQPVPPGLVLNLVHEDDLAALVQGLLERWPAGSGSCTSRRRRRRSRSVSCCARCCPTPAGDRWWCGCRGGPCGQGCGRLRCSACRRPSAATTW